MMDVENHAAVNPQSPPIKDQDSQQLVSASKSNFGTQASKIRESNHQRVPLYPAIELQSREIRLAHLLPRSKLWGIIRCDLKTARLDKKLKYEALSYEWGPPHLESQIMVNGHDVAVRQNLWQALEHLRLDYEVRVLWIDALCINQNDISERNHQVAQMGEIYSYSRRCIAWVGNDVPVPEKGLRTPGKSAANFARKRQPGTTVKFPTLNSHTERNIEAKEHESFVWLCCRAYWDRLWIIQEVLL